MEAKIRENVEAIKEKLKEELREDFQRFDADNDGLLTKDELRAFVEKNSQKWEAFHESFFEGLDLDNDQKVTFEG